MLGSGLQHARHGAGRDAGKLVRKMLAASSNQGFSRTFTPRDLEMLLGGRAAVGPQCPPPPPAAPSLVAWSPAPPAAAEKSASAADPPLKLLGAPRWPRPVGGWHAYAPPLSAAAATPPAAAAASALRAAAALPPRGTTKRSLSSMAGSWSAIAGCGITCREHACGRAGQAEWRVRRGGAGSAAFRGLAIKQKEDAKRMQAPAGALCMLCALATRAAARSPFSSHTGTPRATCTRPAPAPPCGTCSGPRCR
jgi:hypothetical protein